MRPPVVETPDVKGPATPVGSRFFKAVRRNGTDFHTGTVRWLPADGTPTPEGGWLVEHPKRGEVGSDDPAGYLSAASVETDCTGFSWPARLLLVEPDGAVWTPNPESFPHKRAAHAWRVVGEIVPWRLFGPQGREVAALIEQTADLDSAQIADLTAAWDAARGAAYGAVLNAARGAARDAARGAAYGAARDAARGAARDAAWGAAYGAVLNAARGAARDAAWGAALDAALVAAWRAVCGWLVADLISDEHFRTLTGPWEQVMGPIEVIA